MNRRDFLRLAVGPPVVAALSRPDLVLAQAAAKIPHVIVLTQPIPDDRVQAIYMGLQDYGYTNGKNINVEFVTAPTVDDVSAFAARVVAAKPDLIVTLQSTAPLVVKSLTTTIPVVFTGLSDPVAIGVVDSYAHPGGNLTGNMQANADVVSKQLQIIKDTMPTITRLALLALPTDPTYRAELSQAQATTTALGISTILLEIKEVDPLAPLFEKAASEGAQAIYYFPVAFFLANVAQLSPLAIQHGLPSFGQSLIAAGGGLIGYSSNNDAVVRRSAYYVDAILKGAKPGDLPVEQPTVFDWIVNLKTASALGITVPQSVVLQATQVIQ